MAMIQTGGAASGLDIQGLISQLVAAERQPTEFRLNKKEVGFQTEISGLGTLKSALSAFQSAVEKLKNSDSFNGRSATSSDTDIFTVTADSDAVAGNYDVEAFQLATAHQVRSSDFAYPTTVVGTGQLTISQGTDSFTVDITSGEETLEGIRDAINGASNNVGVSASIVNVDDGVGGTVSRLVLASDATGVANQIKVEVDDDDLTDTDMAGLSQLAYDEGGTTNMVELVAEKDAIMKLYGQNVTRSSNTISDAVDGLSFTLKKESPGVTETASVELNKAAVSGAVGEFVKAFNDLASTFSSLGAYNQETGQKGALLGDSTLRQAESAIRNVLANDVQVDATTTLRLTDMGITTTKTGQLEFDGAKLDTLMETDFGKLETFFSDEDIGFAYAVDSLLTPYTESSGVLDSRVENLNSAVDRLADSREQLTLRVQKLEKRLLNQFTALEEIIAGLQQTSSFLGSQLSNLPGMTRKES